MKIVPAIPDDNRSAWSTWNYVDDCRKFYIYLRDPRTHRLRVFANPCGSWRCEDCAAFRAGGVRDHARHVFGERSVWVASFRNDPAIRSRFNRRCAPTRSNINRLAILRIDWTIRIFCSADVSASGIVAREMPASAAECLLQEALAYRGFYDPVADVTWSDGWKPFESRRERTDYLGRTTGKVFDDVWARLVADHKRRAGVTLTRDDPIPDDVARALKEALDTGGAVRVRPSSLTPL